ncbi:hypothetical protein EV132_12459 [Rhizobium sullae]|uniref:Uncharacterized protein n=1 Tax=Rhizobium sullae TaxID=50338 RepID=A0A4R3PSR6_RHISU|nr:hypothetical protein EV132_12459 [Rhizobium sullae]
MILAFENQAFNKKARTSHKQARDVISQVELIGIRAKA